MLLICPSLGTTCGKWNQSTSGINKGQTAIEVYAVHKRVYQLRGIRKIIGVAGGKLRYQTTLQDALSPVLRKCVPLEELEYATFLIVSCKVRTPRGR